MTVAVATAAAPCLSVTRTSISCHPGPKMTTMLFAVCVPPSGSRAVTDDEFASVTSTVTFIFLKNSYVSG